MKSILDEMAIVEKNILFSTCVLIDNRIYAFTQCGYFPVKINLSNKDMSYIDGLEGYQPFIADEMLSDGENIYVLELNGERLLKWNLLTKKCDYFIIKCGKMEWGNCAAFVYYKENIFIFPKYRDSIIKIDVRTGELEKRKKLYTEIKSNVSDDGKKEFIYFNCGCSKKNLIWLFREQNNQLVVYDLDKDNWKKYTLSLNVEHCVHIAEHSGNIYFLNSRGKIYCWDMKNDVMKLLADCVDNRKIYDEFGRMAVTDKKIYLLPAQGENIICISTITGEKMIYQHYPKQFRYSIPNDWSKYYGYSEDEKYFYFAMRSANFILGIDKERGEIFWIKPNNLLQRDGWNICKKYYKNIVFEGICSVKKMLEDLNRNTSGDEQGRSTLKGRIIWEQMRR